MRGSFRGGSRISGGHSTQVGRIRLLLEEKGRDLGPVKGQVRLELSRSSGSMTCRLLLLTQLILIQSVCVKYVVCQEIVVVQVFLLICIRAGNCPSSGQKSTNRAFPSRGNFVYVIKVVFVESTLSSNEAEVSYCSITRLNLLVQKPSMPIVSP